MKTKIIKVYKNSSNFRRIPKDELRAFLNERGYDLKKSSSVKEMKKVFLDFLTEDTLDECNQILHFGLFGVDVMEVLGVSRNEIRKLYNSGMLRTKTEVSMNYYGNESFAYIYDIDSVVEIMHKRELIDSLKPKECKPIKIPEPNDRNIAEALYQINKSAKVSRDTKKTTKQYGRKRRAWERKTRLYHLKDKTIEKLIAENRMQFVGYHWQPATDTFLKCFKLDDFTFHRPIECDSESEEYNILMNKVKQSIGIISADRTRKDVKLSFTQAEALLINYTGISAEEYEEAPYRYY